MTVSIHFQKRIMTGLFGGEGFIMQKLEGDGWVFVQFGGAIIERKLAAGELLHVDTGRVAAMTLDVDFDIVRAGSVKSMIFGGEGVFFAEIKGRGMCGCRACRSRDWLDEYSPMPDWPVVTLKALCSGRSAEFSTAIIVLD